MEQSCTTGIRRSSGKFVRIQITVNSGDIKYVIERTAKTKWQWAMLLAREDEEKWRSKLMQWKS